jgi:putative ABC transport system permease protein
VVLKVLGATRAGITRAFVIEYGIVGVFAALVAGALGTVAARFLVTRLMNTEWVFLPAPLLRTVLLATTLTVALGFVGTWRALSVKAAPYLRNE